jgi:polyvinyl alcohol dehydrogenase (cytochrome)
MRLSQFSGRCRPFVVGTLAAAALVTAVSGGARAAAGPAPAPSGTRAWDWPTYGHDAQHTFRGRTTLTAATTSTLKQAWSFSTGDAVTATPTVVDGTVYVGSWDGYFYAVALRSGRLRWKYQLSAQPAVTPYPGENPRNVTSDGGLVTSSAWFEPGSGARPDLVLFAGGYTLYALNAQTGALFWRHEYTGRPEAPPDPIHDGTRIFSSPVVFDGKVLFGVDVDGAVGYRGYIVAASLRTGEPVWEYQTDVDNSGQVRNDGCGNVWSSGTILPTPEVVVFTTGDCHGGNAAPLSESVLAFRIKDGRLVWQFRPTRVDDSCDVDFGATANAGLTNDGRADFLGVGGKDGTYYSLDPHSGQLRWATNVVFGGAAGGFIATTAYDGHRVYGSTALGDVGGPCNPGNPRDTTFQEPTAHAFDAQTGTVVWEAKGNASFGPTTVAGHMTFNAVALKAVVKVRDASSGKVLAHLHLAVPCWSGIATAGDAVVLGTGTTYKGSSAGIVVFTPGGAPPVVPATG